MMSGRKREREDIHPRGSVLLAARSDHVDLTMQVTDTFLEGRTTLISRLD